MKEIQNIAFIKNNHSPNSVKNDSVGLSLIHKKNIKYDNINLFRYSALTYNSHRIHYDLNYTRNIEGYESLLVHGPLIATKVLNEVSNITNSSIKEFNFSIHKPIFVNEKVILRIYFLKSDKTILIAKIFKIKNELAFKSEIKLSNQPKFSKG